MKRTSILAAIVMSFGLAALDAEAARRFGGGGNTGKQRATPAKEAPTATPAQAPAAAPATASPAAAPATAAAGAGAAAAAAKPSFMQRWGGLLAGLGIGALLAGLFGAQLGPMIGLLLAVIAVVAIAFLLFRLFAGKRAPSPETRNVGFAGIGSNVPPATNFDAPLSGGAAPPVAAPVRESTIRIPGFEVAPFVRVAKTSFIRLQAANDSGDLDDIRSYTTPEMYAEITMQLKERGGAQKTEVVSVDAEVLEAVVEDGYEIASVRFWGLIRENDAANPEPFDEIWHVQRKAGNAKAAWLIAGIQQHTP